MPTKAKRNYKLDDEEQEILDALESGQLEPLANSKEEAKKLRAAARAYINKSHRVNIRLTEWEYQKAQENGLRSGIPPTTLIASIVHKFFTGQLIERTL